MRHFFCVAAFISILLGPWHKDAHALVFSLHKENVYFWRPVVRIKVRQAEQFEGYVVRNKYRQLWRLHYDNFDANAQLDGAATAKFLSTGLLYTFASVFDFVDTQGQPTASLASDWFTMVPKFTLYDKQGLEVATMVINRSNTGINIYLPNRHDSDAIVGQIRRFITQGGRAERWDVAIRDDIIDVPASVWRLSTAFFVDYWPQLTR